MGYLKFMRRFAGFVLALTILAFASAQYGHAQQAFHPDTPPFADIVSPSYTGGDGKPLPSLPYMPQTALTGGRHPHELGMYDEYSSRHWGGLDLSSYLSDGTPVHQNMDQYSGVPQG